MFWVVPQESSLFRKEALKLFLKTNKQKPYSNDTKNEHKVRGCGV